MYQYADLMKDFVDFFRKTGAPESSEASAPFQQRLEALRPKHLVRVLVSDDSRTTQKLIATLTDKLPIQVSFTNDGLVALGRLLHESFDVFITGGTVANLGGLPTIAAMRLERPDLATKTILLSSSAPCSIHPSLAPDVVINRGPEMMRALEKELSELGRKTAAVA